MYIGAGQIKESASITYGSAVMREEERRECSCISIITFGCSEISLIQALEKQQRGKMKNHSLLVEIQLVSTVEASQRSKESKPIKEVEGM